ncbi:MAG TPA: hypothetical protein DEA08_39710 [Planctomycetes bacterium]|nr:hypothetical protein [Planctomycetota bacterium]
MIRLKIASLFLAIAFVAASCNGCAAFIDAGFRELDDHGDNARYEHKSYLAHVADSWLEDDDDDCRSSTTTVVVHHHRR